MVDKLDYCGGFLRNNNALRRTLTVAAAIGALGSLQACEALDSSRERQDSLTLELDDVMSFEGVLHGDPEISTKFTEGCMRSGTTRDTGEYYSIPFATAERVSNIVFDTYGQPYVHEKQGGFYDRGDVIARTRAQVAYNETESLIAIWLNTGYLQSYFGDSTIGAISYDRQLFMFDENAGKKGCEPHWVVNVEDVHGDVSSVEESEDMLTKIVNEVARPGVRII